MRAIDTRPVGALLIDGVSLSAVSALDRGLHFGDGLFETIACLHGRPRFLTLHLERLALGCDRLGIAPPDATALRREIEQLAGQAQRSIVKIILTRGPALARGYAPTGREKPTRIAIRYPWPEEDPSVNRDGARVRIAATRLGENPALAGLKHCNRLEQILARSEAGSDSADEALMLSRSGRVISGTMSNVFVVEGSGHSARLCTPSVALCGVAGVMRRVVLREAARSGIPVAESVLSLVDLAAAREVFLTNARIGILPVRSLAERSLGVGPVTRRLQERLEPVLSEPADG
jgi:4-amino-4-deoxychorismate lyase